MLGYSEPVVSFLDLVATSSIMLPSSLISRHALSNNVIMPLIFLAQNPDSLVAESAFEALTTMVISAKQLVRPGMRMSDAACNVKRAYSLCMFAKRFVLNHPQEQFRVLCFQRSMAHPLGITVGELGSRRMLFFTPWGPAGGFIESEVAVVKVSSISKSINEKSVPKPQDASRIVLCRCGHVPPLQVWYCRMVARAVCLHLDASSSMRTQASTHRSEQAIIIGEKRKRFVVGEECQRRPFPMPVDRTVAASTTFRDESNKEHAHNMQCFYSFDTSNMSVCGETQRITSPATPCSDGECQATAGLRQRGVKRVLILGLGAGTMAGYLSTHLLDAAVDAVEIDVNVCHSVIWSHIEGEAVASVHTSRLHHSSASAAHVLCSGRYPIPPFFTVFCSHLSHPFPPSSIYFACAGCENC